ncbi:MAG: hypothetical protein GWN62_25590 [Aliifodinibius sp.]|nr:hypothetical protein [Fodinibius sp.]
MPTLSRWFIKAGIIYFVISLLLALLIKLPALSGAWSGLQFFRPVFYHTLMVGWITQIIIGVSIWMFPRHTRQQPRGSEALGWWCFYLLNAGLALRVVVEPLLRISPLSLWKVLIAISTIAQWIAGMLYIINIWKRVKARP